LEEKVGRHEVGWRRKMQISLRAIPVITACMLCGVGAASADSVSFEGDVTATTVGSTLTTDLPEFDSSLGVLTGVSIMLDLDLSPFAQAFSVDGVQTFSPSDWISFEYTAAHTITFTHGADSWDLAAPAVGTGTIAGSGQEIPELPSILTIKSDNSAPLDFAESGTTLAEYIGSGVLSFETAGAGDVATNMSYPIFVGGGGELTGTAEVTYEYVPEPSSMAMLMVFGAFLIKARRGPGGFRLN
jgi:hypothetical protein